LSLNNTHGVASEGPAFTYLSGQQSFSISNVIVFVSSSITLFTSIVFNGEVNSKKGEETNTSHGCETISIDVAFLHIRLQLHILILFSLSLHPHHIFTLL
jgi:hypothetical protein